METDTEGAETESDTEEAEPESDTEGAETKSNTEGADTESGAKEAETESGAGGGALMGRIRALEQSLAATREALQHDRCARDSLVLRPSSLNPSFHQPCLCSTLSIPLPNQFSVLLPFLLSLALNLPFPSWVFRWPRFRCFCQFKSTKIRYP